MRAYRKIEDGYEFKVEGGRLVLLGVGAFLTLVLVFLVGVLVGKGLWGSRGEGLEPLVHSGGTPERGAEPSSRQYTFYEDLKRPDSAGQPPPPPTASAAGPASETSIPAPATRSEGEETASAKEPEGPTPGRISPDGSSSAASSSGASAAAPASSPLFTVQVGSFRDRASADDQIRRIGSQGISGQVVPVSVEGRTWYRVQVGKFGTRAEAEAHYQKRLRPKGVQGFVTAR